MVQSATRKQNEVWNEVSEALVWPVMIECTSSYTKYIYLQNKNVCRLYEEHITPLADRPGRDGGPGADRGRTRPVRRTYRVHKRHHNARVRARQFEQTIEHIMK